MPFAGPQINKQIIKTSRLIIRHQPAIAGHLQKGGVMRICRLLRRKAASDYLHEIHGLDRAPTTLAKLAVIGNGPIFRRIGRVPLYSTDDLDEWVASKLSEPMRSTSDTASPKCGTIDCCQQAAPCDALKHADNGATPLPTTCGDVWSVAADQSEPKTSCKRENVS